ncbi:MAG: hypothetical protein QNJ91_17965, partial [Gammaproteobacteria bacterium]|nr:hypothetical protein [Gammaproteobacteria bacterium]
RGGASRAGRYSHEWAWRLNYDDLYGHDDSANDLDVWSAEIGYNRVLWEVGEGCIAWHLDLTAGYEDFDSRRFRGSNWYVTPSIYLACAPEARKQDGEVEMKGGGSYRYYRRGQVIRPTIP